MDAELDAIVRRVDEDRWMASRLAPPKARARLIGLYAANYEIARTAETVREPALGDMRLQFWRNAVQAMYAGAAPPAHPAAEALAVCVREASLPREPLEALIEARAKDLDSVAFETWADLDGYVDATSGGLIRLAAIACAPGEALSKGALAAFAAAGRAWGFCGLARAAPAWAERGRTPFPAKLLSHVGLSVADACAGRGGPQYRAALSALLDRAEAGLREARRLAREAPAACFPAMAHVALTPAYAAVVRDGERARAEGPLSRRLRLMRAAALGAL